MCQNLWMDEVVCFPVYIEYKTMSSLRLQKCAGPNALSQALKGLAQSQRTLAVRRLSFNPDWHTRQVTLPADLSRQTGFVRTGDADHVVFHLPTYGQTGGSSRGIQVESDADTQILIPY